MTRTTRALTTATLIGAALLAPSGRTQGAHLASTEEPNP